LTGVTPVRGFESHPLRFTRDRLTPTLINTGGEAMSVVLVHQGPTVTQENYEETVRRLTDGKSRMESASDWPVEGLLVHVAGEGPQGFRVVDVWESEEAANAFGETLRPVLEEVGITDPPELYSAHTFVTA
jgi:hypothetical protein